MDQMRLKEKLRKLPDKPGVYVMKDGGGRVIYVGKASSLRNRVRSYFHKGHTPGSKTLTLVSKVDDIDWLVTTTELEALMLECNLIKQYRPRYNVRLRDDKHYPYICVTTSDNFPRAVIVRRVKENGDRYFGPFADSATVRESLRLIRKVFRLRACSKKLTGAERDRPCLNFHMRQCESPCSGRISTTEYAQLVKDACLFLEGKIDSIIERLNEEMMNASEALEFERAARLRDQIQALQKIGEYQQAIRTRLADQDILAISLWEDIACVQVLFVRQGRLIGKENFFMEGVNDDLPGQVLEEFIKQFYKNAGYIPPEILTSHELAEVGILQDWLSLLKGAKVRLIHPKRGEKRRLVDIAIENVILTIRQEYEIKFGTTGKALKSLQALADTLGMTKIPERIEAYDISNLQGQDAVGSMVVFENGEPVKSQYRRFKIRVPKGPDDCAMIGEVLTRRMSHIEDTKFARLPDLIVVDGGKGQLNAALAAIENFQRERVADIGMSCTVSAAIRRVRVISLAKRFEEIYSTDADRPLVLPADSEALHILQRVRDEAHRFAHSYHEQLREKRQKRSILESIRGVGDARQKALIRRFGSVAGIKKASLEELQSVPGITRPIAEAIKAALCDEIWTHGNLG